MMVSDLIKYEFIETFHRVTESQWKPRGVYSDYANTFEASANLLNFIAIKYRNWKVHGFFYKQRFLSSSASIAELFHELNFKCRLGVA